MKLVWSYLAIFAFNLILGCAIYSWYPAYRHHLFKEDYLVENLSVFFYLLACFGALWLGVKRNKQRGFLLLVFGLGLIGFLEEVSFGEGFIFPSSSMPRMGDTKIDSLHDLFTLTYEGRPGALVLTVVVIGALVLAALASPRTRKLVHHARQNLKRHHFFLAAFFSTALLAGIIDLEFADQEILFVVEEILELNASLALIFCCLAVFARGRRSPAEINPPRMPPMRA